MSSQIADRGAFGSAHPLDLLLGIDIFQRFAVQLDIPPGHNRISRDDLHRFVELLREQGSDMRMPVDDRLHRVAQALLIQAFIGEAIESIADDGVREIVIGAGERWLAARG